MKRLTIKTKLFYEDGTVKQEFGGYILPNGNERFCKEEIQKLGMFEDFMEEQGFESLEELKKCFEIWNSEDDNGFLKDTDNKTSQS